MHPQWGMGSLIGRLRVLPHKMQAALCNRQLSTPGWSCSELAGYIQYMSSSTETTDISVLKAARIECHRVRQDQQSLHGKFCKVAIANDSWLTAES